MRVAVIGSGVSGSLAARLLASRHEVTLYEAADHLGGHAQTVDVEVDGVRVAADVAFMVFNRRTYPNFCRMLELLGIDSRASDMSFSVRCDATGLEYQGSSLDGLFAQRRNAVDPRFWRMIADIVRFNRSARRAANNPAELANLSAGDFVEQCGVGRRFVSHYLAPMAAAIWSSRPSGVLAFPAPFLIGFFQNHGLLQLRDRPQWRTITGGSRRYVAALLSPLEEAGGIRTGDPVVAVERRPAGVAVRRASGSEECFDEVVFATHADQTLAMLHRPTADERQVLSAFPYQPNRAVLHTDASALPSRSAAWASWNYRLSTESDSPATVTYDLTRLQGLKTPRPLLLTLNPTTPIDPGSVIREFHFTHPAYSADSIGAQPRWDEISGRDRIHYCGAYWGYGFHEDGVNSALAVAKHFGIGLEACTAACTRGSLPTAAGSR
ncbi:hypothetical protein Pla123a_29100 [Posidoniimonas polymericola]|uniref:Amine oxidase domain-containing protein n=1 Tax=Posidoniimonas polymericola TaxID=2528002 RepID=A0A5C5YMC5_9BACT|nr:FAD-dependent oxidoreductase [Posidoniimonas polymericola]TWT76121.1 hypothetical protein Pla123a_29100 [Posidoniimonas polymericola]